MKLFEVWKRNFYNFLQGKSRKIRDNPAGFLEFIPAPARAPIACLSKSRRLLGTTAIRSSSMEQHHFIPTVRRQ